MTVPEYLKIISAKIEQAETQGDKEECRRLAGICAEALESYRVKLLIGHIEGKEASKT